MSSFNDDFVSPSPLPIVITPSGTGVNIFATNDNIPATIETTLLTYTVVTPIHISQLIGWGTYVGEFLIKKNGVIVGGGRTSAAEQTLDVDYETAPIVTAMGDTITVTILHYGPGLRQFRCNLLGE
jgi:hypothetical protein